MKNLLKRFWCIVGHPHVNIALLDKSYDLEFGRLIHYKIRELCLKCGDGNED